MIRVIDGTFSSDIIEGDNRASRIYGYEGDDVIYGYGGSDGLYGGTGNDDLYGGAGNDWLNGQEGDDVLIGGSGRDHLYDGTGFDQMFGGKDRDTFYLTVDDTIDYISGGSGSDVVDISSVTQLDTAYVTDQDGDGILSLFWKDLSGLWQQDQIKSVAWVKDADGAYLNVNDIFVV
jgi:Ca2+-binding RTX toxin-like protein